MTHASELMQYENALLKKGRTLIAGVDEAGRGPLAGPVFAGAVIMPFDSLIDGVNDSKKLSEKKREELYALITERAITYKSFAVYPDVIDSINILNATKLAMKEAVFGLFQLPEAVFIDAVKLDLPYPVQAIIHGDALSYSIAAASIIAKVERDRLMLSYAEKYPEYHFEQHKGYGTKLHIEMLKKYGPCEIHRKSFIGGILS